MKSGRVAYYKAPPNNIYDLIILIPRNSRGYERVRRALKTCVTRSSSIDLEADAIPRSPDRGRGTTGESRSSLSLSLSLCCHFLSFRYGYALFPRQAGSAARDFPTALDPTEHSRA